MFSRRLCGTYSRAIGEHLVERYPGRAVEDYQVAGFKAPSDTRLLTLILSMCF